MKEIVFIGRGGYGVLLAGQILAEAANRSEFFGQAFPEFTPERRGATIESYVRIDSQPIRKKYKMSYPADILVVLEPSLVDEKLLKKGGALVITTDQWTPSPNYTVIAVAASTIARELDIFSAEGRPLGNIAALGALLKLLPGISMETLQEVIGERLDDKNVEAAARGFSGANILERDETLPQKGKEERVSTSHPRVCLFPVSTSDTLGNFTGAWRFARPVFTETCTACRVCEILCPDNVIFLRDGKMEIDYNYCKGCGICVEVCPLKIKNAIFMEEEK